MKKAIDNYAAGKQIEVTAWKGESIPASSRRFFCPECMESVALDIRGYFRHKNRTAQSIECEKRVDGSLISPYEKMGIPIYLKESSDGLFDIFLGFSPLEEGILEKTANNHAFMNIVGEKSNKFYISEGRFSSECTTYIKIDFLPINDVYKISYSDNVPEELIRIWTNHSDKWGKGRFFKCGDNFNRKVRSGGAIVIETEYYFMGNPARFSVFSDCIEVNQCGTLSFKNYFISINNFKVKADKLSNSRFSQLSRLLMERYQLNLLVGESELLPIWPPAIADGNRIIFDKTSRQATFLVDSPNDNPKLFRYFRNTYVSLLLLEGRPILYDTALDAEEIPFSVDRAFNGYIQFVNRRPLKGDIAQRTFDIIDENGNSILNVNNFILKNKRIIFVTNFAAFIRIKNERGRDSLFKISDSKGICLDSINFGDTVTIYSLSWNPIFKYSFESHKSVSGADDSRIIQMLINARGNECEIDNRILVLERRINKNSEIYKIVKKYIKKGKIPKKAYEILLMEFGR